MFSVLYRTYAITSAKCDSLLNILNSLLWELCLKISVPSGLENQFASYCLADLVTPERAVFPTDNVKYCCPIFPSNS